LRIASLLTRSGRIIARNHGHKRAPVVADEDASASERLDQLRDVADDERQAIRIDAGRFGGVSVAAQVGRDDAKAGARERRDLMPPRAPVFRKTVKEDDERSAALLIECERQPLSRVTAA
jgi:hypothetical protein